MGAEGLSKRGSAKRRWWAMLAGALLGLGFARDVAAYTIESTISEGCHERITSEALRRVRGQIALPSFPLTDDERRLIADLQFTPDEDMRDLEGATLLIGVRDNDLKHASADDIATLSQIHSDPAAQAEHCLRSPSDDEPTGSQSAILACHAFVLERVAEAIDGLDEAGMPDGNNRSPLQMHLAIRGDVRVYLPTYYLRIGQAIHAVEDGFSHNYRTDDATKIVTVLNWVDAVDGASDEAKDGPAHSSTLDECTDADEQRRRRRELATETATQVLLATLGAGRTKQEKLDAVQAILDQNFALEPGCTADNGWCDASEATLDARCDCAVAGSGHHGYGAAALAGTAALLAALRRARKGPSAWADR